MLFFCASTGQTPAPINPPASPSSSSLNSTAPQNGFPSTTVPTITTSNTEEMEEYSALAPNTTFQPPSAQPTMLPVHVNVINSTPTITSTEANSQDATQSTIQVTASQSSTIPDPVSSPINYFTKAQGITPGPEQTPVTRATAATITITRGDSNNNSSSRGQKTIILFHCPSNIFFWLKVNNSMLPQPSAC